jgi:hypothetical protein
VLVGSSYPFLDVMWTMLVFFIWVAWFLLLFRVFIDVFRRHDIGGGAKTLWLIFVIILPFLGVFVYIIAEGKGMAERNMKEAQDAGQQMAAMYGNPADQIASAKQLLDTGAISQAEFDTLKAKALA